VTHRSPGDPIKARPICLLNEIGKWFEKVIRGRIENWVEDHSEARLSDGQFGFRPGRSTIDALQYVKEFVQKQTSVHKKVVIVVGLDIKNAFNSIPWDSIRNAVLQKGFSPYIRRLIDHYLSDRYIAFEDSKGEKVRRMVSRGVPQGPFRPGAPPVESHVRRHFEDHT